MNSTWPEHAFPSLKVRTLLGAQEINSLSEASAFVQRLDLAVLSLPHWQMARQALYHAGISEDAASLAWREFRNALMIEGWLDNQTSTPHP